MDCEKTFLQNMPPLRGLLRMGRAILQRCRSYGAAEGGSQKVQRIGRRQGYGGQEGAKNAENAKDFKQKETKASFPSVGNPLGFSDFRTQAVLFQQAHAGFGAAAEFFQRALRGFAEEQISGVRESRAPEVFGGGVFAVDAGGEFEAQFAEQVMDEGGAIHGAIAWRGCWSGRAFPVGAGQ